MTGFNQVKNKMKRAKVVTHSKDAKKPSLAVLKYRKAHSSVSIFENKSGPRHKGYKSMSLGMSQTQKFLIGNSKGNNKAIKHSQRTKVIKSASSPNFRNHIKQQKQRNGNRNNRLSAMDMLPVLRPESLKQSPLIKQQQQFNLDVQNAMSLAKESIRRQRNLKNSNSKGAFISNNNNNNNNKANNVNNMVKKQKKRRKQQEDESLMANSFFVSKKKVDPNEVKLKREQQIEYERSQMVDRIKNISMKTAKKYRDRQLRRKDSGSIDDNNDNKKKKQRSKKVYTNVTKAITPRFGRGRGKTIKKRKNDGLKSHVKIKSFVSVEDAGEHGDPYEAQRCQLCLAVPKASAGYKLVWMW